MPSGSEEKFFSDARILGALDADGRRRLIGAAEKMVFADGETVVREGEAGDALYLIADGKARVAVDDLGSEKQVAELGDGAIFGEMAVITCQPRSATVTACGRLEVLKIPKETVLGVLKDYPKLRELIARLGVARSEDTLGKMRGD